MSLTEAVAAGVPERAAAIYTRWWQLETWLRELIYTELRVASGLAWAERFESVAGRLDRDRENAYMASADADERLAYADFGLLLEVVRDEWELFKYALPPQVRWNGLADELRAIRNRNAHCRRPHQDDLARLEQALRDLESGAREFYRSYSRTQHLNDKSKDPVVRAWFEKRYSAAARLIDHCEAQYEVGFALRLSRRPWAETGDRTAWSGESGFLWRAEWSLGPREVDPLELWGELPSSIRELLVHLLSTGTSITATFATVDDPEPIIEAIGDVFDLLITYSRDVEWDPGVPLQSERPEWKRAIEQLPPKAQASSALALFDPYNPDLFSIFRA